MTHPTDRQLSYIRRLASDMGWADETLSAYCDEHIGIIFSQLDRSRASRLIDSLKRRRDEAEEHARTSSAEIAQAMLGRREP
jgi:hypothetical protein